MRIAATPRLFIEPPKREEADLFVSWLNDPEVVKYSEQRHKKHDVTSQRDYWWIAGAPPNGVHTIYLAKIEKPIGSVAYRVDPINKVADVGIMIGDKSEWKKGYGFEAWQATCNYLFYSGIARKVEAGCMSSNKAMIAICFKYKMSLEGLRPAHFMNDDLVMYGKSTPCP